MLGLAPHGRLERRKRPRAEHDGLGAPIQCRMARAFHHLGRQHTAVKVDRHGHDERAIELFTVLLGKALRAALFNLAAQHVVINGIGRLAGGRADVALAGGRIFFVDAPFNFGQKLHELLALFFLRQRLGRGCRCIGLGRRHGGQRLACLQQQMRLLCLERVDLTMGFVLLGITGLDERRRRQRRGGAALLSVAASSQRCLRNGNGLLGLVELFPRLGVDQNHFERRVLKHAVKALRVGKAQRQQRRVHRNRNAQGNMQRAG